MDPLPKTGAALPNFQKRSAPLAVQIHERIKFPRVPFACAESAGDTLLLVQAFVWGSEISGISSSETMRSMFSSLARSSGEKRSLARSMTRCR